MQLGTEVKPVPRSWHDETGAGNVIEQVSSPARSAFKQWMDLMQVVVSRQETGTLVSFQVTGALGKVPLYQPTVVVIIPPGLIVADDTAAVRLAHGQLQMLAAEAESADAVGAAS